MGLKDDISNQVSQIIQQSWDIRDGRIVPANDDIALSGGGVRLPDATVLYVDLAQSSRLATDFQQRTAAKVIRIFLSSMCRLITDNGGTITSFDGDRVMGVFLGDSKNSDAAICALKMNYVISKIVQPAVNNYFTSVREAGFSISHSVGIDTSAILAVKAGLRGANDIVWVGRAPNLAAKLCELRENYNRSYISEDVFLKLNESAKYGGPQKSLMWEKRSYGFLEENVTIYSSSWYWEP